MGETDYQKSSRGYEKEPKKDSPGDALVNTTLPMQAVQVQSLVRELRSHMLHGTIKKGKGKRTKIEQQKWKDINLL